jgi:hypothetical protein
VAASDREIAGVLCRSGTDVARPLLCEHGPAVCVRSDTTVYGWSSGWAASAGRGRRPPPARWTRDGVPPRADAGGTGHGRTDEQCASDGKAPGSLVVAWLGEVHGHVIRRMEGRRIGSGEWRPASHPGAEPCGVGLVEAGVDVEGSECDGEPQRGDRWLPPPRSSGAPPQCLTARGRAEDGRLWRPPAGQAPALPAPLDPVEPDSAEQSVALLSDSGRWVDEAGSPDP